MYYSVQSYSVSSIEMQCEGILVFCNFLRKENFFFPKKKMSGIIFFFLSILCDGVCFNKILFTLDIL